MPAAFLRHRLDKIPEARLFLKRQLKRREHKSLDALQQFDLIAGWRLKKSVAAGPAFVQRNAQGEEICSRIYSCFHISALFWWSVAQCHLPKR